MSLRPTKRSQSASAGKPAAAVVTAHPAKVATTEVDAAASEAPVRASDLSPSEPVCLGLTYRDRITGFTGIATGHATYLTSSPSVLLSPRVGDSGGGLDPRWFDEASLVRIPDNLR
ncbi:hypothetical protein AA12717_1379 [Gluconacetobacter sacchari DSM 12717]|uniref:Uncharacterized protein n=2 Tax=Gluconacetobacter sacchari TaxID=92759 RepID=A0A7W4IB98_9PROT|nr:hypothetical protein [Gluconacetobacter sacchari]MBB2159700.1 hypothetical protein [Gluconacetobacter sacchari]GBQ23065.1 hypothetical protein AA12717_1379 [Gluconacetobacter sacchari DSM 12717]